MVIVCQETRNWNCNSLTCFVCKTTNKKNIILYAIYLELFIIWDAQQNSLYEIIQKIIIELFPFLGICKIHNRFFLLLSKTVSKTQTNSFFSVYNELFQVLCSLVYSVSFSVFIILSCDLILQRKKLKWILAPKLF